MVCIQQNISFNMSRRSLILVHLVYRLSLILNGVDGLQIHLKGTLALVLKKKNYCKIIF